MFRLTGLVKSYNGQRVLGPLDLHVCRGEVTVLIGPSGSGKSTLLRCLIGLINPDQGTLIIDGQTNPNGDRWMELRQGMGYVIQDGGLFPHLSARRNVGLMAEHLGWSEERRDARIEVLRQLVQLSREALTRFPDQLSGGQKQRVALMRALMLEPQVLLLDEPFAALDPMVRVELQQDLRKILRDLKMTTVLVTHDLHEACEFADRIVLLKQGEIVQAGPPREILEQPRDLFVQQFVRAQRGTQTQPSEPAS